MPETQHRPEDTPTEDGAGLRRDAAGAAAVYARTRHDLVETVTALSESQLETRVPATPDWTVRDVLAHVVGIAVDLNAQHLPEADDEGGAAWAAIQIARGRTQMLDEIVATWTREAPAFEEGLRIFGYEIGAHFAADLHAHNQDVRSALGMSRDTDPVTLRVALDHYLGFLDEILTSARWGTLEVVTEAGAYRLGRDGAHNPRLRSSAFEALRVASARRSPEQIRALDWEGDVDGLIAFLQTGLTGGYALPDVGLAE